MELNIESDLFKQKLLVQRQGSTNGFPTRFQFTTSEGTMTILVSNPKFEMPSASLFEIPQTFQKLEPKDAGDSN